jgi:hypothetical protein
MHPEMNRIMEFNFAVFTVYPGTTRPDPTRFTDRPNPILNKRRKKQVVDLFVNIWTHSKRNPRNFRGFRKRESTREDKQGKQWQKTKEGIKETGKIYIIMALCLSQKISTMLILMITPIPSLSANPVNLKRSLLEAGRRKKRKLVTVKGNLLEARKRKNNAIRARTEKVTVTKIEIEPRRKTGKEIEIEIETEIETEREVETEIETGKRTVSAIIIGTGIGTTARDAKGSEIVTKTITAGLVIMRGEEIMIVTERIEIDVGLNLGLGQDLNIDQDLALLPVHAHALKAKE